MTCTCNDWKENIGFVNDTFAYLFAHNPSSYKGYEGKSFTNCPWCGKLLQKEGDAEMPRFGYSKYPKEVTQCADVRSVRTASLVEVGNAAVNDYVNNLPIDVKTTEEKMDEVFTQAVADEAVRRAIAPEELCSVCHLPLVGVGKPGCSAPHNLMTRIRNQRDEARRERDKLKKIARSLDYELRELEMRFKEGSSMSVDEQEVKLAGIIVAREEAREFIK